MRCKKGTINCIMEFRASILCTVLILVKNIMYTFQEGSPEEMANVGTQQETSASIGYIEEEHVHDKNTPTTKVLDDNVMDEILQKIAKNISHSKGAFISKTPKEVLDNGLKMRRSISRKLSIDTQSNVVHLILDALKKNTEINLSNLRDLEHLVHQYEVAFDFAKSDGIKLLLPYMTSPDKEIVSTVALILGAAMQGNPDVQRLAFKQEVGNSILSCLEQVNVKTLSHILFALSAYLRNMHEAQSIFLKKNGVMVLSHILKNPVVTSKSKLKIVTLLHDLRIEYQMNNWDKNFATYQEYQTLMMLFENQIKESEFCQQVPTLLAFKNFDAHEKVIAAMKVFTPDCIKEFSDRNVIKKIEELIHLYSIPPHNQSDYASEIDVDLRESFSHELRSLLDDIHVKNIIDDKSPVLKRHIEL